MVLFDGVEDDTADAAGVTTAQPWRDTDTQVQYRPSGHSHNSMVHKKLSSSSSSGSSAAAVGAAAVALRPT